MSDKKSKGTHSVMPRKLAEALMEAGVKSFNSGGEAGYYPTAGLGSAGSGQSASPTTQGTKADYGQTFKDWGSVNIPGMLQDYGNIIQSASNSFTPQSQFVATAPQVQGQNFMPQVSALQARQAQVYQQQQNLAQALLQQSQGQGPNPAQTMLNQNTGQSVQGQAALMASQRGAGVNPALMARQAALQGAGIQQQAVGQAATMQAQQQLAAQAALMQQQQTMGSQALQGEGIQQQGLSNQNQLSLGAQGINAQTAQANADRSGKGVGGLMSSIGSMAAMASGGGKVGGDAQVQGDSQKNDTVPALLSPGEIVIPRSIAQSEDAPRLAAEFISHLKAKKGGGYGEIIQARQKKMSKGGRVC